MANYRVLTNNPDMASAYPDVTAYLDVPVQGVFVAVRDAIHRGAALISHPLAGSIKPNISPYKSVVLSTEAGPLHEPSLVMIEDAIATLQKLPAKDHHYSAEVLADFSAIDLDLIRSAMQALPSQYH